MTRRQKFFVALACAIGVLLLCLSCLPIPGAKP
jgi:hypothetical protein